MSFVDALDECDENKAQQMATFFEELCDCAEETNTQVQVCFSRRHYPEVVVQTADQITLEDKTEHAEDIQKFIKLSMRTKSKQAGLLWAEIL